MDPDFLGLSIEHGYKEHIEHVFDDPSRYTPGYKSFLLTCGAVPSTIAMNPLRRYRIFQDAKYWTRQDLARWLDTINYLLSRGCKSELTISLNSFTDSTPYKMTGLEAFLWALSTLLSRISWDLDLPACGLVLKTLQHFLESSADFIQTIYGYYGREGLVHKLHRFFKPFEAMSILFGPGFRGEHNRERPFREVVVVEWSIFGALTHAVNVHRDVYFCRQLQEFLATIRKDKNSFSPRIIAIRHLYDWISHTNEDATTKMKKLDDKLNQIITSILDDGDVPEGVFEYFLGLGFVESWPRFLARELQQLGFTRRRDEDGDLRLPGGVIYPPVKFVDQRIQMRG
ncbi:hypothetical protein L207DRAFT_538881 [Hyaloscypha variabilis F]|uniref:Uncharacterized protein n=1 Tax=Hyaloscypha variabilis (strain UAMH 11265 / GT02V1 / F) TaxID=1149755 RepID=A0A2J6QT89_HYAVF|nr:hypothetical protein L207DRAFT_538881 [Hyaloscypha variabilis F]